MSAPDVRLEGVVKHFDDVVAVDGISLEIPAGSFFALLGPSGCGKTTTLRMIGGFEDPDGGAIYLGDGQAIHAPASGRAVIVAGVDLPYWKKHFVDAVRVTQ